jgi:16S rRNA (cytosine1407-C5)-methyltransferase
MILPSDFSDATRPLLGNEAFDALAEALEQPQSVSIRLNDKLEEADTSSLTDKVAWCERGRYLDRRPAFTFDPLLHAGAYYVQEASSMFIEQVVKEAGDSPLVALDLCAAPGGKSTLLSSVLPKGSLLVANELVHTRAEVLAENMMKWGDASVIVTSDDPSRFASLRHQFDLLLTDMPCSGEGMFRKDEEALRQWSLDNVEMCAHRQREIISSCWQCLRPGGLLIYSTCTFNTKEDEENVQWICKELGAEVVEVPTKSEWHITGNLLAGASFPVYRFIPGRTRGEGLFVALLRKEGNAPRQEKKYKEPKKGPSPIKGLRDLMTTANSRITDNELYHLSTDGKTINAFPKAHVGKLENWKKVLHILHSGVTIGDIRGHDLIPTTSLALSKIFRKDAFASQELTYEEAITFLRRETFLLHPDTPRGTVLLTYHHLPLGFVKNMGNRTNNLYPQEWRIRSGYMPEERWTIVKR